MCLPRPKSSSICFLPCIFCSSSANGALFNTTFLLLIDDLQTDCLIHKYVDDTTLTEIIHSRNDPSNMKNFFHHLLSWSNTNDLSVNFSKTKEMVMGPSASTTNLPLVHCAEGQTERVISFKLLGLHLDADSSWQSHVEAVTSKATKLF